MYYVTVVRDGEDILRREPFADYAAALNSLTRYYRPKSGRCVLEFTTEIINGEFARSYTTLTKHGAIGEREPYYKERYERAVKQENRFEFEGTYLFLVESDYGMSECGDIAEDDDET